jgi:general secretion pathway protein D
MNFSKFFLKSLLALLVFSLFFLSFSCSPKIEKEVKVKADKESGSSTPNIAKLVVSPPPPQIGGDKLISFSVNEQIPLKDVLIELGRVAEIDIDLDSGIVGGVVINAKNRPLKEVIDRIATLGKLRYSYVNDVLYFERDLPYSKNYFVDFLSNSQLWGDVESNISAILSDSSESSESLSATSSTSRFNSNKSAGILSVYATRDQHEKIQQYLDDVYKNSSAQVLIEAKVVEIVLNKEFSTGIDWNWVSASNSSKTVGTGSNSIGSTSTPSLTANFPTVQLPDLGGTLSANIQALEEFGKATAISSPRINAINNQKATLDFTQKKIYFTVSSAQATATGTATNTVSTVTATQNQLDIGVKLEITPSINLATNEITLEVKPNLSIDTGEVAIDPSVNPTTGESLGNTIPIINTREINTIAKIQSGNILVIGGLISENNSNDGRGIPILLRIPILKYVFGFFSNASSKTETVIFIKATIINSGSTLDKNDKKIYGNNSTFKDLEVEKNAGKKVKIWDRYFDYTYDLEGSF